MFAKDGDRWGDPRAKLLAGEKWTAAEPKVLTALGLECEPAGHLAELASARHAASVQVAAGPPDNSALEVVGGRRKLARLGKAEEPKFMPPFRQLVNGMLCGISLTRGRLDRHRTNRGGDPGGPIVDARLARRRRVPIGLLCLGSRGSVWYFRVPRLPPAGTSPAA
ncbi:hypothetical protein [Streptomyces chiangmaiensis]|uniref:Uncharacterized protein n=1 Tax=Streptomyces chiangmaiensis TaxID=766497 RepID=A0ABU7FQ86_9ACTN|nr:hypothetical protein [Streptomyces chiangmaiensis]MED7826271.1 hypothetical protein [Streptomyces chiangmaiensis]